MSQGKTHAIVIGNEAYAALPTVNYAVADMESIADHFIGAEIDPVEPELVTRMPNVTRSQFGKKLRAAFERVQRSDSVIIYFAGHGLCEEGDFFLLPVDYGTEVGPDEATNPSTDAISYRAVIKRELARKRPRCSVLVLDACHSGSALDDSGFLRSGPPMSDRDIDRAVERAFGGRKRAHLVLAACAGDEKARSVNEFKHGLFTHFLLEGMQGLAHTPSGRANVGDVFRYAKHEVVAYARLNGFRQTPEGFGTLDLYLPSSASKTAVSPLEGVNEIIDQARAALAELDFAKARELVEKGRREAPYLYELKQLDRRIDEAERNDVQRSKERHEERTRQDVERLWADAEEHLNEGDLELALKALLAAERIDVSPDSAAKRQALEARIGRSDSVEVTQVSQLLNEARSHAEHSPAKALELYRQVLKINPQNSLAPARIQECEGRIRLDRERGRTDRLVAEQRGLEESLQRPIHELKGEIAQYRRHGMDSHAEKGERELAGWTRRKEAAAKTIAWLTSYAKALSGATKLTDVQGWLEANATLGCPADLLAHHEGSESLPARWYRDNSLLRQLRSLERSAQFTRAFRLLTEAARSRDGRAVLMPGTGKECPACKGTGTCRLCQGQSSQKANCRDCRDTGTCYTCKGRGQLLSGAPWRTASLDEIRKRLNEAKSRFEKALHAAKDARKNGDLDMAKANLAEAQRLCPQAAEVRGVKTVIDEIAASRDHRKSRAFSRKARLLGTMLLGGVGGTLFWLHWQDIPWWRAPCAWTAPVAFLALALVLVLAARLLPVSRSPGTSDRLVVAWALPVIALLLWPVAVWIRSRLGLDTAPRLYDLMLAGLLITTGLGAGAFWRAKPKD
jgi:tetratricopeptide (TPR) repeat protein